MSLLPGIAILVTKLSTTQNSVVLCCAIKSWTTSCLAFERFVFLSVESSALLCRCSYLLLE